MKLTAEILVGPGRGYVFRLHSAPPPGFLEEAHIVLEEISFYDGEDDVLLVVDSSELSGRITKLEGLRDYEVTFAGTVEFTLADERLDTFLEVNSEQGVDYTLFLTSQEHSVELVSGEDWEFVENRNVVLTVVKA